MSTKRIPRLKVKTNSTKSVIEINASVLANEDLRDAIKRLVFGEIYEPADRQSWEATKEFAAALMEICGMKEISCWVDSERRQSFTREDLLGHLEE